MLIILSVPTGNLAFIIYEDLYCVIGNCVRHCLRCRTFKCADKLSIAFMRRTLAQIMRRNSNGSKNIFVGK